MERRECWVITEPDCLDLQGQWPQLKAAVRVLGHRTTAAGSASCCITSPMGSAEQLLAAIRSHRSIENSFHRNLDVSFVKTGAEYARITDYRTSTPCGRSDTTS